MLVSLKGLYFEAPNYYYDYHHLLFIECHGVNSRECVHLQEVASKHTARGLGGGYTVFWLINSLWTPHTSHKPPHSPPVPGRVLGLSRAEVCV